jgi:hypothetical protein
MSFALEAQKKRTMPDMAGQTKFRLKRTNASKIIIDLISETVILFSKLPTSNAIMINGTYSFFPAGRHCYQGYIR